MRRTVVVCRLDRLNVAGLLAFRAGFDLEGDLLSFFQALETSRVDCGKMGKQIFAASVWRNEAEALGIVEPPHTSSSHCMHLVTEKHRKGTVVTCDWVVVSLQLIKLGR
jgi:hypothetical protein